MCTKFQVGKKYIDGARNLPTMRSTFNCLFVDDANVLLEKESTKERYLCYLGQNETSWLGQLVEVKPKRKAWINVYNTFYHSSRELADVAAGNNRIACIEIEFEEGQGL